MAFISSSKNSSNEDSNTICVTTASTAFPTGSINVATISQDTASAYIASQSNGSQIKFKDINQIDEDDIEEMDIKWNMALLSMRADKFWKRTRKKISIQGSDVAGLTNQKLSASTVTRWVTSQESAEHPKVKKEEGKKAIDKGLKLRKRL
uniref:Uncharacterized protein n=1 Tax=Tanacetum cinerariifolium TaxID=118510 RepID=A0A6L2N2G5_TANCI|nr:hypothetical protein [Tanacetum cinerariifolium]